VGIGRDKTLPNMRRTWGTEAEQKFIWVLDAPCVGPIGTPPTSFTGNSLRDLIYLLRLPCCVWWREEVGGRKIRKIYPIFGEPKMWANDESGMVNKVR